MQDIEIELFRKIKILNETIWEAKAKKRAVENWLSNFSEEKYRINALYLLTHFIYFSKIQISEMLKSMYRDLFRYPIIYEIRKRNNNTLEEKVIEAEFKKVLDNTRFVSIGGPSESSTHLLYPFAKINEIHKDYLINEDQIEESIKHSCVKNFVFIDDLAGSGTQASIYLKDKILKIKNEYCDVNFFYMVLICTNVAKETLMALGVFKNVKAVYEMCHTFRVFDDESRYYKKEINSEIDKDYMMRMAGIDGTRLYEDIWELEGKHERKIAWLADRDKLGFKDGQLLLGFEHNTPSNTLPIIWYNEPITPWNPIFKRFNKIYNKK